MDLGLYDSVFGGRRGLFGLGYRSTLQRLSTAQALLALGHDLERGDPKCPRQRIPRSVKLRNARRNPKKHFLSDVFGALSVAQDALRVAQQHRPELLDQPRHGHAITIREAEHGVQDRFSALWVHLGGGQVGTLTVGGQARVVTHFSNGSASRDGRTGLPTP